MFLEPSCQSALAEVQSDDLFISSPAFLIDSSCRLCSLISMNQVLHLWVLFIYLHNHRIVMNTSIQANCGAHEPRFTSSYVANYTELQQTSSHSSSPWLQISPKTSFVIINRCGQLHSPRAPAAFPSSRREIRRCRDMSRAGPRVA